jgi:hypothetical protein
MEMGPLMNLNGVSACVLVSRPVSDGGTRGSQGRHAAAKGRAAAKK